MSQPNRRNALALVATLPALAVPAALAAPAPDPIFEAIERYRKLDADWLALAKAEDAWVARRSNWRRTTIALPRW
jgi:hypothetical protein